MNIKGILMATAIAVASLFLTSCEKDEPQTTKVFGAITIENASTWSTYADSGEVQVTLFSKFSLDPLAGWGVVPDNFFGPNVPGGTFAVGAPYNSQNPLVLKYEPGKTVYTYEIEVEPGTYSALALGFRHNLVTDPSRKTATLGVHWDKPDQVSYGVVIKVRTGAGTVIPVFNYPTPVTFTIAEGEQKEINFKADFNFVKSWYR
ncbi:MAG: hypothetical protein IPH16_04230 [Haliscomenobacter sp.]|nr:hypothetical protein [Haliscomenobacter sp.]MBK7475039.1 hypothetical protein [Haliscomenobacter sp.]MBK8879843.1 hypothetical protein [Haliscomenobacter sp.]